MKHLLRIQNEVSEKHNLLIFFQALSSSGVFRSSSGTPRKYSRHQTATLGTLKQGNLQAGIEVVEIIFAREKKEEKD